MKIVDTFDSPGTFSKDFLIRIDRRDLAQLHALECRPMNERDFAKLIKKHTKNHYRVRWAKQAARRRRMLPTARMRGTHR